MPPVSAAAYPTERNARCPDPPRRKRTFWFHHQLSEKIRISPREIYTYSKNLNHRFKTEAGTSVKGAMDIVKKYGAGTEKDVPYKSGDYKGDLP